MKQEVLIKLIYMLRNLYIIVSLLIINSGISYGQVKIRLFAGFNTDTVIFQVVRGQFEIAYFPEGRRLLKIDQEGIIIKNGRKIVIKTADDPFWSVADSVSFIGVCGNDLFSLYTPISTKLIRIYSGDLHCKPDLGTNLLINTSDIESYIAGVVKSEGGSGRHPEYFKTQAVIARTYMYRHLNRHRLDKFDLCDDVHCQAFNGIADDSLIIKAAIETKGMVIIGPDSKPIIAAFHANCGGETLASEDMWLTGNSYLKKVLDPYCTSSRNSHWIKRIAIMDWIGYLKKSGMTSAPAKFTSLNFNQPVRMTGYRTGNFSIPFAQIRTDLGLRSSFFSVKVEGNDVILNGRGYGHGIGLCQEGAMVMASKGFDFKKIIGFYYRGVTVSDIGIASATE